LGDDQGCLTERTVFNPFKFSEYHTATNDNYAGPR
jgi:hypothetical protein